MNDWVNSREAGDLRCHEMPLWCHSNDKVSCEKVIEKLFHSGFISFPWDCYQPNSSVIALSCNLPVLAVRPDGLNTKCGESLDDKSTLSCIISPHWFGTCYWNWCSRKTNPSAYLTHIVKISWLLMSWWHKEPGHQQAWYWPSSLEYSVASPGRVNINIWPSWDS